MRVIDLKLVETGDGGDVVLKGNDLEMIEGFQNMPYLALFGGNVEDSTTGEKVKEQAFDYWGNFLLHPTQRELWLNSGTERLMLTTAITTSSRIRMEEQVKKDLEFMKPFAIVESNVFLVSEDRISISISISQPTSNELLNFSYIWDATNNELSITA